MENYSKKIVINLKKKNRVKTVKRILSRYADRNGQEAQYILLLSNCSFANELVDFIERLNISAKIKICKKGRRKKKIKRAFSEQKMLVA